MRSAALFLALVLAGCTDTDRARFGAISMAGDIVCFSGGREIYRGRSTGVIQNVQNSHGWQFKDDATGHLIRLSGDCIITH